MPSLPHRYGVGGMPSQRQGQFSLDWSTSIVPRAHRRDIADLYRFFGAVYAMAHQSPSFDDARDALWAAKDGLPVGHPAFRGIEGFFALQQRRALPTDPGISFLDGVMFDLSSVRIRTEADLIRYSYQAASSMLLLFCHAADVHTPGALAYAIDLGIALRLTEVARDVARDAQHNRIYLPAEWIEPTSVVRAANGNRIEQERVYVVVLRLLALAESYYRSADYGMRHFPLWARGALLMASRTHESIGAAIRQRNLRYWDQSESPVIGRVAKAFVRVSAALLFHPRYRRVAEHKPHCAALHTAIVDLYGANQSRPSSLHVEYGLRF